MSDVLFIADFFSNQINGGGELNNAVLVEKLYQKGHSVQCVQSHLVKHSDLQNKDLIIISNFVNLSETIKASVINKNYIIYEHDHKYIPSRNPAMYENYLAPEGHIINKGFYSNAGAILCQSTFHAEIVKKNLRLENIVSLGGNLWSDDQFTLLQNVCTNVNKRPTYAVMQSSTPHKNTYEAVQYCEALCLDYYLIPPSDPSTFLQELGSHSTLVFFPKTPETLSRIVVEARMMGLSTKITNNIGAIHEDWFSKKGLDLIDYMRGKQEQIVNIVLSCVE